LNRKLTTLPAAGGVAKQISVNIRLTRGMSGNDPINRFMNVVALPNLATHQSEKKRLRSSTRLGKEKSEENMFNRNSFLLCAKIGRWQPIAPRPAARSASVRAFETGDEIAMF
jgi:hypothetical protein